MIKAYFLSVAADDLPDAEDAAFCKEVQAFAERYLAWRHRLAGRKGLTPAVKLDVASVIRLPGERLFDTEDPA